MGGPLFLSLPVCVCVCVCDCVRVCIYICMYSIYLFATVQPKRWWRRRKHPTESSNWGYVFPYFANWYVNYLEFRFFFGSFPCLNQFSFIGWELHILTEYESCFGFSTLPLCLSIRLITNEFKISYVNLQCLGKLIGTATCWVWEVESFSFSLSLIL